MPNLKNMSNDELQAAHQGCLATAEAINERSQVERRDLTMQESGTVDALMVECEKYLGEMSSRGMTGRKSAPQEPYSGPSSSYAPHPGRRDNSIRPPLFAITHPDGKKIRALRHDERFSDVFPGNQGEEELSWADVALALMGRRTKAFNQVVRRLKPMD
jgi:hypothetical protein